MSALYQVLIFLNFYSAVTIYPNIYIEHYPYGLLLFLVVSLKEKKINNYQLLILSLLLLSVYLLTIQFQEETTLKTWKLFVSYINFISPIFFLKYIKKEILLKSISFIFYVSLLMGGFQYLGVLSALNIDLSFMISRFSTEEFGGYRGVSLFATEPVRASFTLFCASLILSSYRNDYKLFVIAFLFDIFLIRSTTGLLLYLIVFAIVFLKSKYKVRGTVFIIASFFIIFFTSDFIFHGDSKIVLIINAIKQGDIRLSYVIFDELSGGRVAGIINGIVAFFQNPLGSFAYSDVLLEGKIIYEGDYNSQAKISHTPVSGFITFANLFGILFLLQVYLSLKNARKILTSLQKTILVGGASALFLYSPPGMSLAMLTLLILRGNFPKSKG